MKSEPTDRDLITQVLTTGDELAFRQLYRRHTPALLRTAIHLLGPSAERPSAECRESSAEEFVHDTWIRAVDRFDRFEWRSRLSTWLTAILLNRIREARRESSRPELGLEDIQEPAAAAVDLDDRLDLEQAIARLPEGYRAAIVLHDIEGFTHDEVGSMLGIEAGTSKSQLSRARQALRHWLEPGLTSR